MTEHLALEADRSSALAEIDALAYVDELAPKDKEAAEALIDQELHTMKAEGVHAEQYVAYMRPAASYCAFEVRTHCEPAVQLPVVCNTFSLPASGCPLPEGACAPCSMLQVTPLMRKCVCCTVR